VARLLHNMARLLQRASVSALMGIASVGAAAAATHIAAATRNSVPAPSKDARKLPIDVSSSKVDYKGDTVVFQDVVITQGDTKVEADHAHATGLDDFDNSHWTFEGNVRINGEQHGSLKSDQAIVEFRNKYISKATITGNPAEFEQKRTDTPEIARGHAHQIVYNVNDGTIRLSKDMNCSVRRGQEVSSAPEAGCGDPWLSDGHNEISGAELIYNIREQRVQGTAGPGSDNRVHIRIEPKADEEPNKKP
jgi:lipopolysaccharide transport protein LptA